MKDNKKIAVITQARKDQCILKITDNGPGIPPDHIDKIFNPFFTTKDSDEAMGFGLSIVQEIVHEMGGTIKAKNIKNGGAQFIVSLPALPTVDTERS